MILENFYTRAMENAGVLKIETHACRWKGFTILELLIVVSLVLVLAALILPLTKKGLEAGYRAKCVSNLRTLATGLLSYTQDNDGELPPSYADASANYKVQGYWPGLIYHAGYLPSPDSCFCPATAKKFWKNSTFQKGLKYNASQSVWGYVSYGATRLGVMPTTSDMQGGSRAVSLAKIVRPASTLLLVESGYPKNVGTESGQDGWYWLGSSSVASVVKSLEKGSESPGEPGPTTRHGKNLPVAFCDGHVEVVDLVTSPVSTFSKASDEPWCEGVYTK